MTVASLEAQEAALQRKTLGQLLNELRTRADIHPEVEGVLQSFLRDRNRFIHHLEEVENDGGPAAVLDFTKQVILRAHAQTQILAAILAFWMKHVEKATTILTTGGFCSPIERGATATTACC